jgi:hypothetical protein
VWIDEFEMKGNIVQEMCKAIDLSAVVAVFVTERYAAKLQRVEDDNCKREFDYAVNRKTTAMMVPVVMEKQMRVASKWPGALGMNLGNILYVDMVSDEPAAFKVAVARMAKEIKSRQQAAVMGEDMRRAASGATAGLSRINVLLAVIMAVLLATAMGLNRIWLGDQDHGFGERDTFVVPVFPIVRKVQGEPPEHVTYRIDRKSVFQPLHCVIGNFVWIFVYNSCHLCSSVLLNHRSCW